LLHQNCEYGKLNKTKLFSNLILNCLIALSVYAKEGKTVAIKKHTVLCQNHSPKMYDLIMWKSFPQFHANLLKVFSLMLKKCKVDKIRCASFITVFLAELCVYL